MVTYLDYIIVTLVCYVIYDMSMSFCINEYSFYFIKNLTAISFFAIWYFTKFWSDQLSWLINAPYGDVRKLTETQCNQ